MPPIELDEIMSFLLSKYDQQDIKNSMEKVMKEFEELSKTRNSQDFDSETLHKLMNRKYG
jgi:hypothetical protein